MEEYPNYDRHRRRQNDEFNNIQLRFHLAELLMRMRYGEHRIITQDQAMRAWPPTGEHAPRTFENDFRALSLARAGHRPETSYTTQERIINDLDESFDVRQDIVTGNWYVSRRDSACPKCKGRKIIHSRVFKPADFHASTASMESKVAEIKTEPCDCKPA